MSGTVLEDSEAVDDDLDDHIPYDAILEGVNISHVLETLGDIFGASDEDSDSGLSEDGGSDTEWHDCSTDDDDSESESDADAPEPIYKEAMTPSTVVEDVSPVFWTYARDAHASSSTCCILVADDELRTFRRCAQRTEKRSLDSLCLGWEVDARALNSATHRAVCHSHYCRDRDLRKELGVLATAPVTCSERHCWFCNAIIYVSSSVARCFRFRDRLVHAPADLCRGFVSADSITQAPPGAPVTYVCHTCMSAAGAHFWQPGGPRGPRQACQHDDAAERLADVQSWRLADKASKAAAFAASKAATEEAAERARAEKQRQAREVERQAADAGKQLAQAIRCHMAETTQSPANNLDIAHLAPAVRAFAGAFLEAAKGARTRKANISLSRKEKMVNAFLASFLTHQVRPMVKVPILAAIASMVMAHKSRAAALDVLARLGVAAFGSQQWHRRWRDKARKKTVSASTRSTSPAAAAGVRNGSDAAMGGGANSTVTVDMDVVAESIAPVALAPLKPVRIVCHDNVDLQAATYGRDDAFDRAKGGVHIIGRAEIAFAPIAYEKSAPTVLASLGLDATAVDVTCVVGTACALPKWPDRGGPLAPAAGKDFVGFLDAALSATATAVSAGIDASSSLAALETRLQQPRVPVHCEILPSPPGTADTDAGIKASMELTVKEGRGKKIAFVGDNPIFARQKKLKLISAAQTEDQFAHVVDVPANVARQQQRCQAHALGVKRVEQLEKGSASRPTFAVILDIVLANLRALVIVHPGATSFSDLLSRTQAHAVQHCTAHLVMYGLALLMVRRGIRLGHFGMQMAGLSALAPVFTALGRYQYATWCAHVCADYELLMTTIGATSAVGWEAGHMLALDEAFEQLVVLTAKTHMTSRRVDADTLRLFMMAVQDENELIYDLMRETGVKGSSALMSVRDEEPVARKRTASARLLARHKRLSALTDELARALSLPEGETMQHPLYRLALGVHSADQRDALFHICRNGYERFRALHAQEVLRTEARVSKGRGASELWNVGVAGTVKTRKRNTAPAIRKRMGAVQSRVSDAARALEEGDAATAMQDLQRARQTIPLDFANVTGEPLRADKSNALAAVETLAPSLPLSAVEKVNMVAVDATQTAVRVLLSLGTITFARARDKYLKELRESGMRAPIVAWVADRPAYVPVIKLFEQQRRDGDGAGVDSRDPLDLATILFDDYQMEGRRWAKNRELRAHFIAACFTEWQRADSPVRTGAQRVVLDGPGADPPVLLDARGKHVESMHRFGEADHGVFRQLMRRSDAAVCVADITDSDAIDIGLLHLLDEATSRTKQVYVRFRGANGGRLYHLNSIAGAIEEHASFRGFTRAEAVGSFVAAKVLGGNDMKEKTPMSPSELIKLYIHIAGELGPLVTVHNGEVHASVSRLQELLLRIYSAGAPRLYKDVERDLAMKHRTLPTARALQLSAGRAACAFAYVARRPAVGWLAPDSGFSTTDGAPPTAANFCIQWDDTVFWPAKKEVKRNGVRDKRSSKRATVRTDGAAQIPASAASSASTP